MVIQAGRGRLVIQAGVQLPLLFANAMESEAETVVRVFVYCG